MDDRPRLRADLAAHVQRWSSILLLLGIAVRFIHHALFDGTMFTLQYYIVDTIILLDHRHRSATSTRAPTRW